jgi:2-polyprenyl-6-methoxyphenol hydroxylase-like FAD-dependent oxidoreductase
MNAVNQRGPAGRHYDVVIAGAGAVGPALAIELSLRGIDVLLVEALPYGAYKSPRTNLTNVRSMEHFRRWGIADAHRASNPIPDVPRDFVFLTRLDGYELLRFPNAVNSEGQNELFSEAAEWAEQAVIEVTLRKRVEAAPSVEVRWGRQIVDFEQSDDGVLVNLEATDSRETETVSCSYLAGCDGSRSVVRRQLGVKLEGKADLNLNSGMAVRAPALKSLCKVPPGILMWFINSDVGAWLGPLDSDAATWYFHVVPCPEGCDPDSFEDMRKLLYLCVGEEFPVEYVSGGRWVTHSLLAPKMREGRVFIVGDAAHLIPPTGGFGMNIGLLDAVDLGWKLAATIRGWAGPRLLGTYFTERHGAEQWVISCQEENNALLSTHLYEDGMERDDERGARAREHVAHKIVTEKAQEFSSLGCQLGYRYEDSPIIVQDDTDWPAVTQQNYVPSAHPGCLAPHHWLADGRSLYDAFGPEFTLLNLGADEAEAARIITAAGERGVPLELFTPDEDEGLRELYRADLVLIRPDQHVAWRADAAPADPLALIDQVRGA